MNILILVFSVISIILSMFLMLLVVSLMKDVQKMHQDIKSLVSVLDTMKTGIVALANSTVCLGKTVAQAQAFYISKHEDQSLDA